MSYLVVYNDLKYEQMRIAREWVRREEEDGRKRKREEKKGKKRKGKEKNKKEGVGSVLENWRGNWEGPPHFILNFLTVGPLLHLTLCNTNPK